MVKSSIVFGSFALTLLILLFFVEALVQDKNGLWKNIDFEDVSRHSSRSPFILSEPLRLMKTEAGKIEVIFGEKEDVLQENKIGLHFITMEPQSLLLPQYIDASYVLYVQQGKVRLGWVKEDELNQEDLVTGDVFVIPGGTVFYLLNTDVGQRLRTFGFLDTSHSLEERGRARSFFVAGGMYPHSLLSGFDPDVLATAFKVSREEVMEMISGQIQGPIVFSTRRQLKMLNRPLIWSWSWNFVRNFFPDVLQIKRDYSAYNLLKKRSGFKNKNGWSIAVDGKMYQPLKIADAGVFAVSLKPGAILAPHWNPSATEVAMVTTGSGMLQISFPNGTTALDQRIDVGSIFVVPRYFPMSQIASRDGPFEFVGFSTSSFPNDPRFLVGSTSVLRALDEETLGVAFDFPAERVRSILDAQDCAVILPGLVEESETSV